MTVYHNAQLNYFNEINNYKKGVHNIKKLMDNLHPYAALSAQVQRV